MSYKTATQHQIWSQSHTHTVFELFKEKHMPKGASGVVCKCSSKTWNVINDLDPQIIVIIIIKDFSSFKVNRNSKLNFLIQVTYGSYCAWFISACYSKEKKCYFCILSCNNLLNFCNNFTFSLTSLKPHDLNSS